MQETGVESFLPGRKRARAKAEQRAAAHHFEDRRVEIEVRRKNSLKAEAERTGLRFRSPSSALLARVEWWADERDSLPFFLFLAITTIMLRSRAASAARHARTLNSVNTAPRTAITQRVAAATSYPSSLARRPVSSSSAPQATVQQDPPRKAPVIQTPLPSISSTVSRLLPSTVDPSSLPFPRPLAESLLGSVIEQVRNAADAKTVEDARAGWEKVDREARGKMQEEGHKATALTDLATVVVTASNDPRRHPIAFNLYRIAFGSDPASLPHIELDTSNLSFTKPDSEVSSSTSSSSPTGSSATWGDWQSAYHWATLILQGRAPPPPGTALLLPGEQRSAQASQSSAAYRVFAHLATQGHARGLFGIGRHLLSTLERGVDPTSMGAMPSTGPARSRQETIAEVERLYRLAGEGGVEEAWFQLGAIYVEGKWVRKDEARARSFLEEGVSRGSPRACQALAQLLTREVQTPQAPSSLSMAGPQVSEEEKVEKLQKALAMLERGAELGSAECAFAAGMRYLLQDAPPPAPAGGQQQQQAGLDPSTTMDMSLDPSRPSPSRGAPAQPTQDPQAHARAAHRAKWGVDPSDSRASGWLTRSAEGGNAVAMMNLARMHLEGRVPATTEAVQQDGEEAGEDATQRKKQLLSAADLYSKILARAMGPEGQRAKALKEIQKKLAERAGGQGAAAAASSPQGVPEPGLGGTGLDDLGARAEEGLRMVREEMEMIAGAGGGGERV